MTRRILFTFMLVVFCIGILPACSGGTYVQTAPPEPPQVDRPPQPRGQNVVWVPGHYEWTGNRYVWREGYWIKSKPGKAWIAGRWERTNRGWRWIKGHWK